METTVIFVDRSVFESENFFSGSNIKRLASFAKGGYIQLKITEVTYREIKKGFKDHLAKSKRILKEVRKEGRILKNLSKYDGFNASTYLKIDTDYEELCAVFEEFIKENNIEVIDNSYIELENVINDYFDAKKPFGEGQKKSEFPDAFIVSAIEKYSADKNIKSNILSNDKDIIEYESSSGRIITKASIGELIGEINKHLDEKTFEFINARAYQDKNALVKIVEEDYGYDFDDEVIQIINDNPFYEEGEVYIESIQVNNLNSFNILEIGEKYTTIEYIFEVDIVAQVSYNDLSTGFYDKEDGQWWGVEYVDKEKSYYSFVKITIVHMYDFKKQIFSVSEIQDFEIESFD